MIEGDVWTTFFRRGYQFESCLKKVELFRLAHVISVYFLTATITADSDILSKSYPEKSWDWWALLYFLVLTFWKIEILRVHFYQLEIYFAKKCIIEKTWKKWIKKIYKTPKIHRLILIIWRKVSQSAALLHIVLK